MFNSQSNFQVQLVKKMPFSMTEIRRVMSFSVPEPCVYRGDELSAFR